ncbi:MAG: hypothetical protein U0840_20790 [Gemmataceae bacterium]
MIRIHLPPDEADRLDGLFRAAQDQKLRLRLQIVIFPTESGHEVNG